MNSQIEALNSTQKHKDLLNKIYEYFVYHIGDAEFTPYRDVGSEVWLFFDVSKSVYNRAMRELVQMGLLHRNGIRNATYTLPKEEFEVGQRINANEEAKKLSALHSEEYDTLWQLIKDCNRDLRREQKAYWKRFRKCHPELCDYELNYNFQTNVITILSKRGEENE